MASLGEILCTHRDELVQCWYERWRKEGAARPDLSEAVLKDHLPAQLEALGEVLRSGAFATVKPRELWSEPGRLDPEQRVRDDVPIEEVVREYAYVVEEIHAWLENRGLQVPVEEYSYFSVAVFELAGESARRYAAYQADEVRRQRSEFVAGIAHQLRTPVTTLRLYVDTLARKAAGQEDAMVGRLRRTVDRLAHLVEDVLRMERFAPDDLPVRPISLQPAEVVDRIVGDYAHDVRAKGLRLEVHIDPAVAMTADPDLLIDALGNLVQNAIKFTAQGYVRVSLQQDEDRVTFRVEDTGVGIAPERQRTLFQQAHPGAQGGVGLGLSIAHRAALAQGGTIDVESEPGRGSTFSLRLPRVVKARG